MRKCLQVLIWTVLATGAATAGTFPDQPNTLQPTYLTVTYSCPYPLENSQHEVEIDGDQISVIVTLRGNICFDGDWPNLEYAFEVGDLPPGDYDLELRHRTDASQGAFIPPVFQQSFTVVDHVLPRASGLWADESGLGHTVSVLFTESDSGILSWLTYDDAGEPFWVIGRFAVDGNRLVAIDTRSYRGATYPSLDPNDQRARIWGDIEMELRGCDAAIVRGRSSLPGFGRAAVFMTQLAPVVGFEGCTPDSDAVLDNP